MLSFPRASDDASFQEKFDETKKLLLKGRVSYSALFKSEAAIKSMTPMTQAKKADRNTSMVKEPFAMEVEAETDRRVLCERIV